MGNYRALVGWLQGHLLTLKDSFNELFYKENVVAEGPCPAKRLLTLPEYILDVSSGCKVYVLTL